MVNLPEEQEIQSQFTVNNVVSTVASLSLDDVKPRSEIPFGEQAVVAAVFETFDGLEGRVKLLRKDEKHYVQISATFNADLIWKSVPEEEPAPEQDSEPQADGQTESEAQGGEDADKAEKPKIKPEAEVKVEIETLNKRVAEWVYVIPQFRADAILKKPEDLIKKPNS